VGGGAKIGRLVLTVALALAALWVLPVAAAWYFQRALIYFPSTAPLPPARTVLEDAEDVAFDTEDGLRLAAWFVRAEGTPMRGTVLVLPGNGGDRSMRVPLAEALARAGYSVLLTDYRGYAGNPGRPTEEGLIRDARAAREYLLGRPDVDASKLVYFGESLGTAVAIRLAEEHPPAALVLRSPFPSLAAVASGHYPFLPVRLLLRDRFPCADRIARVGCPVLVIAGDADRIVPLAQSRALYDAAGEPKRLLVVAGADHNDLALLAGETMIGGMLRFLEG